MHILLSAKYFKLPKNSPQHLQVRNCQLLTEQFSGQDSMVLLLQTQEKISYLDFSSNQIKNLEYPGTMIRRHMRRGYNDKVFFLTQQGGSIALNQATHHPNRIGHVLVQENILTLVDNEVVAFECDSENFQDDTNEEVTQSLYIVTKD